jgi:TRAP-type C4-dicarboxylate transport system permease large subunit
VVQPYLIIANAASLGAQYAATHGFTEYTREAWENQVRAATREELEANLRPGLNGFDITIETEPVRRICLRMKNQLKNTHRRSRRSIHRGATLIEMAIILGISMVMLLGCRDLGLAMLRQNSLAVAYSFLVTAVIYREVKLSDMPHLMLQTGITTAVVMFLTINLLLLVVGTFMDMTPAVLIFTPIFLPAGTSLGMHEVHFGIMMIANLCIGLYTPPVGTCLFIGCSVGQTTIARVTRPMLPFIRAMFVALMAITYWPALSMALLSVLRLVE